MKKKSIETLLHLTPCQKTFGELEETHNSQEVAKTVPLNVVHNTAFSNVVRPYQTQV